MLHSPIGPWSLECGLPRTRKSCTVWDALLANHWVRDIIFARTVFVLVQYLHLWDTLSGCHLPDQSDRFIWKWPSSGGFLFELRVPGAVCGENPYRWRWSHLEVLGTWPVLLLWVACVAWSLLVLEPIALSWTSGLGWVCTLRTRGRNLRSPTSRMCS
jgi:hypothetical protein